MIREYKASYLKKTVVFVCLCVLCLLSILGCGKKDGNASSPEAAEPTTVATILLAQFKEEAAAGSDMEGAVEKLIENPIFHEVAMGTMPVEEGYLNGFSDEIRGFQKGVMFAPFIGTIPFVGYVFESDEPDTLMDTLKDKAMLNWNICTVADEMVCEKVGSYVFFVMAPTSFDQ